MKILRPARPWTLLKAATDLSQLRIDRWWDPSTKNWVVTLRDKDNHQVGDSIVVYDGFDARQIKKSHPSFNVPKEDTEDRFGFSVPQEFQWPLRKFWEAVHANKPGVITVWNVKTKKLLFTVRGQNSATMIGTKTPDGATGMCGVVPLLKWMKAGVVRVAVGRSELRFKDLLPSRR